MKVYKRTWLWLLWTLGLLAMLFHGYSEYTEFTESKAQSTLDLSRNLHNFSELTEHKSREVIKRIELSSRLLAQQPEMIALITDERAIAPEQLAPYQTLLSTTHSQVSMITSIEGQILYRAAKNFSLIQNGSLSHRPLFHRTNREGFAWDIYYDIASEQPSLLTSILVTDKGNAVGQIVIEHKITWFPLLKIKNSDLLLVNKHYHAGFHFTHNGSEKIKVEINKGLLLQHKRTNAQLNNGQPLKNLEAFQADQTLRLTPTEEFNIPYYEISGFPSRKALISEAPLSDRWSLLIMIPIDQDIDKLYSEISETLTNILLILTVCAVLHKFISFHFKIRELTFTDELTGLHNRQHYNLFVPTLIKLHDREKISNLGLLVIDIDHFKSVNDTYGHPVGDKVLKAVAQLLADSCRESDLVYRFGGEEFLILTQGDTLEQLTAFANRLRELTADLDAIRSDVPNGVTVSIGASLRAPNEPLTELFKRSDQLLYQAKNNGRNRVESA